MLMACIMHPWRRLSEFQFIAVTLPPLLCYWHISATVIQNTKHRST